MSGFTPSTTAGVAPSWPAWRLIHTVGRPRDFAGTWSWKRLWAMWRTRVLGDVHRGQLFEAAVEVAHGGLVGAHVLGGHDEVEGHAQAVVAGAEGSRGRCSTGCRACNCAANGRSAAALSGKAGQSGDRAAELGAVDGVGLGPGLGGDAVEDAGQDFGIEGLRVGGPGLPIRAWRTARPGRGRRGRARAAQPTCRARRRSRPPNRSACRNSRRSGHRRH